MGWEGGYVLNKGVTEDRVRDDKTVEEICIGQGGEVAPLDAVVRERDEHLEGTTEMMIESSCSSANSKRWK